MSTICQINEPKPSKTGFDSLPVEIAAEILRQLNWKDILHARRTCTLLYNASKSREIWEGLIRTHATSLTRRPPTILDKPMHLHPAGKLEERFLRWMKTQSTWLDERPLNEKEIPDSHEFQYSHLLRGGRWLICSDFGGEVLYCDLEAPEKGFVPLIPYPFPTERGSMTMMAVEEDPENETLTFNIALVHMLFADWAKDAQHEVSGDSRVDVWSGRVILDEDGEATRLEVQQLASVPLPVYLGRPLSGVSLRGSLVAFNVEWYFGGFGLNQCDAVIIDWKWKNSKGSCFRRKTVKYLNCHAEVGLKVEVMLLPRDRLLTILSPSLCIYDHSLVPWSSEKRHLFVDMSVSQQHACLIDIPGTADQHPSSFSQVFSLSNNEYRVIFNTILGIKGLVLHYTEGNGLKATVLDLLDWREKMDRVTTSIQSDFSYNCGVACSNLSGSLLRARFSWPDEMASFETGISTLMGKPKETPLVMRMDTISGAMLWVAVESGRVYISD